MKDRMKNKMKKMLLGFFVMTLAGFNVFAVDEERSDYRASPRERPGIFLEPGIAAERSSSNVNFPAPLSTSSGSINGVGLSARLGFHINDIMFLGADGRYTRAQFSDSGNNLSSTSDAYNAGPVLGLQTPFWGIRLAGTYIPWAEINPGETGGLKTRFSDGTGYRVGGSIRVAAVSVNLEFQHINYGTTTFERLGPIRADTSVSGVELVNDSTILGLSFPLSF